MLLDPLFSVVLCRSLFNILMFILINVLSALRFTASSFPDLECLPPKRPVVNCEIFSLN